MDKTSIFPKAILLLKDSKKIIIIAKYTPVSNFLLSNNLCLFSLSNEYIPKIIRNIPPKPKN